MREGCAWEGEMKILEEASGAASPGLSHKVIHRREAERSCWKFDQKCSGSGCLGGVPGIKTLEGLGEKVWDGVDVREDMTDLQQESRRDGGEEERRLRANTQKIYIFILELSSHDLKALHR